MSRFRPNGQGGELEYGGNGKERPFYPASRLEGIRFMALYCNHCTRHQLYERTELFEDECLILKRSVCNKPSDILYPPEWITTDPDQGAYAAACTAFEPRE